jgi:hypothetical protein
MLKFKLLTSPLYNLNSLVYSLLRSSIKFEKGVTSRQVRYVPYHCLISYYGDIAQPNKTSAVCNNRPLDVAAELCHIELNSGP